ncbi:SpoIIE family protein phosphatase [Siccirubricoccus sp. KC 17139]|uniref:SpoIIE family protein phosphatase n=2 Tax=Siccirubricoccus soli TaxID=2899147 RepID=A0ABT1DAM5_9PROT|nr:SpoIIE family protein phosphatase [Siccirubricoccus soli]MCP2684757.1 SpoIIE family protein phosphatase [Siccirubricoccus soli]
MRRPAPEPVAAEPLVHALVLHAPGEVPRRLLLGPAPLRIGRVAGNDLVLPAPEVSRNHAVLRLVEGRAVLADLGSTNGSMVDGVRIAAPVALGPGARIGIGPFRLDYQRGSRAEMERAAAEARDLDRARRYLQALLPPPIEGGPVRAAWCFLPSASLGGDAFGYRWLDAGRFAIYLMDVAGHGMESALLAASVMNLLRDRAGPDPAAVLAGLNASFRMEEQGGLFFTMWYGVADLPARRLRFAAAGHHPALLETAGGRVALAAKAPPIGTLAAASFPAFEATLPSAARLTLCSDGVFETARPRGGRRGFPALAEWLPPHATPLEAVPEALLARAREAAGPEGFDDDVSILSVDFP